MKQNRVISGLTGWIPISLFLLSFFPALTAHAGESKDKDIQLDAVTVTAQKVTADAQDVPMSISVFDGLELEDHGIGNMEQLTGLVPNLGYNKIDAHTTQLNFRGIGGMTNMNKVWNVNIDGVTIPYAALDTFFDVDRVEILRGSQGALYGRNTHAGLVKILTRDPEPDFTADATLNFGSHNTWSAGGALGGPISDTLGFRAAVKFHESDGFHHNDYLDKDDTNKEDQVSARFKLQFTPMDDLRMTLSFLGDRYDAGFDAFAPLSEGASHDTTNNEPGNNSGNLISPTLNLEKRFDTVTLTSITNYTNAAYEFLLDQDFSQFDMMVFNYDDEITSLTQEFRLASNDEDADFKWLAGLFFMVEQIDSNSRFDLGNDAPMMGNPAMVAGMYQEASATVDTTGMAGFGRFTWKFLPKFELAGGLRLDYEKKKLDWQGGAGMGSFAMPAVNYDRDDDWLALLPSASISYELKPGQTIYTSISRGYHSGDYAANQLSLDVVSIPVDPEYTLTYEAGYKGELLNRRLRFNAAAFYIDWTDMQVSVVKDANSAAVFENAGKAHSLGLETDIKFRLTRGLDLFCSAGWLEAKFDDYRTGSTDDTNLKGNRAPNVNDFNIACGANFRHKSGWFAHTDLNFLGAKYLDEKNLYKQDPYTLVNIRAGYSRDNWSISAYGRNLLDEEYVVHSFSTAGRTGDPLTLGVELKFYL